MRPLSSKKLLLLIVMVVAIWRWDKIFAVVVAICEYFRTALAPFHDMPPRGKFVVALLIIALVFITVFKLLYK